MSLLAKVQTGKVISPRRTILYGTEGIGKSSFAADAPSPIFIQTEDGLGDIACAKFPLATTYDMVLEAIGALYSETHSYRNVVIDSLDWLEKLIWVKVAQDNGKAKIDDIGYQKGYDYALDYWRQILGGLSALREEKGMGVILIAHSETKTHKNPEGEDYDRHVPKLHKKATPLIQEWADEVFFASYKVSVMTTGEGIKKTAKAVGTCERMIRTVASPTANAKNRLGMPPEVPLLKDNPYSVYQYYIDQSNAPAGAAEQEAAK